MKPQSAAALAAPFLFLAACDLSPESSHGFRLPDGDAQAGRQVYIDKQCASCHAIEGMEDLRDGVEPEMTVAIGGMTTRVDTYGQFVTSVINPSHKIAQGYRSEEFAEGGVSNMRNYNDVLTVSELIDLVAFLQDRYSEFPDY
ncbi:c-type cytochrome [Hyphococcus luteus]|uniref:Cytochrome C n=1 Tax=Hyphococcus luteus TaxID=2058213 RepID=A0A2S7K5K6_9PROT|nr:c-type cytochrome [Marinicaulis flavus]PQA87795.1 cytochrome C [Marinicaulis flavus]